MHAVHYKDFERLDELCVPRLSETLEPMLERDVFDVYLPSAKTTQVKEILQVNKYIAPRSQKGEQKVHLLPMSTP